MPVRSKPEAHTVVAGNAVFVAVAHGRAARTERQVKPVESPRPKRVTGMHAQPGRNSVQSVHMVEPQPSLQQAGMKARTTAEGMRMVEYSQQPKVSVMNGERWEPVARANRTGEAI